MVAWEWPPQVEVLAVKQLTKSDINLERGTLTLRSSQGEKLKSELGGVGEVRSSYTWLLSRVGPLRTRAPKISKTCSF